MNGEAVYGSRSGPFDYLPWGWTSRKGDMLYLFVQRWPENGTLKVPMAIPVERAWLMASPKENLVVEQDAAVTILNIPKTAPDASVSVVAIKVRGEIPPLHSLLPQQAGACV